MSKELLNPEKALIFRIIHRENLGPTLNDGCHCRSTMQGKNYVQIGNEELIEKRVTRAVPCGPKGVLSDYVPFYFTPYSPMLYNIKTGFNGVKQRRNEDIVIFVSSLHKLFGMAKPRSEEHTSEPSHSQISYAVFCLKKKKSK